MDVAREAWVQQPAPHRSVIEHVKEMRERIDRVMPLVREHLTKAQQGQQRHYNRAEWWSLSPTPPVSSWPAGRARKPSRRRSVPSPTGSASRDGGGQTSYITSTCWRNGWGQGTSSPPSPLWTQWSWTSDYSCRQLRKPSCSTWSVSSQMCSLRPPGWPRSSTTRSACHQECGVILSSYGNGP